MRENLDKWEIDINTDVKIDFDVPSDIKALMNKLEAIYYEVEIPARECTLYGAGRESNSYFFDESDFSRVCFALRYVPSLDGCRELTIAPITFLSFR